MLSVNSSASHYNITPTNISLEILPGEIKTSNFRIIPGIEPISVNIYYSSLFDISLSESIINNLGTFRDITFNVTVPRNTFQGTYKSFICVVANESKCLNLTIIVPRVVNFTVDELINLTATTESKNYFYINFSNTGNVPLNIIPTSTSPTLLPSFLTTFPGFNYSIPVLYDFSNEIGIRNYNITFQADGLEKKTLIYVNLIDTEKPKLIDIKYDTEVKASLPFEIKVFAKDNINISHVSVLFINETINLTKNSFMPDNYNSTITLTDLNIKNFTLQIFDVNNNNFTQTYPIKVNRLGGLQFFDYNPIEILQNFEYRKVIFNTNNEIPLNLSLLSFSIEPKNVSYTLSISGDTFEKTKVELQKLISLKNVKGNVYLDFVASNVSKFEGEMIIIPPHYVGDNKTVKISGKVGNFNILESKNITIGTKTKKCVLRFTGDLFNSSYICQEEYPVTYNFEDITIDITERDYNEIKERANAERNLAILQRNSANLWKWIFFTLFILTNIFWIIYYILKSRKGLFLPDLLGG